MDAEILLRIQQWINCDYQTIDAGYMCYGTIMPKKEPPILTVDSLVNKNFVLL